MAKNELFSLYLLTVWGLWGAEFYNLLPNQAYTTPAGFQALTVGAIIAMVATGIGVLAYLSWPKKNPKLLSHLNTVYEKWLAVGLSEGKRRLSVGFTTYGPDGQEDFALANKHLQDLQYFEHALDYLKKKHKETYNNWIETNTLAAQYNDLAPKTHAHVEKLLKSQLKEAYPTLTEAAPAIENNYYNWRLLVSFVEGYLDDPLDEMGWRRLVKYEHTKEEGRPSTLQWSGQRMISSDNVADVQEEKLVQVCQAIKKDAEFAAMSDQLAKIKAGAEARIEDFRSQLRKLRDDIGLGIE